MVVSWHAVHSGVGNMASKMNYRKLRLDEAYIRILLNFDETKNILKFSFQIDVTYSHTSKTIKKMKKQGIMTIEKKGRENILRLTAKGKDLKYYLEQIYMLKEGKQK